MSEIPTPWDKEIKALQNYGRDQVMGQSFALALNSGFCKQAAYRECYADHVVPLRARQAQMLRALSDLVDYQNGPPLPSYEEGWTIAMNAARAILAEKEKL